MIENFAPNLIRLRKEKKLSQKELAQELGISAQTISNIENQTAYPTFTNLEKIAVFFAATPTQLFGSPSEIEFEKTILKSNEYDEKITRLIQSIHQIENFLSENEDSLNDLLYLTRGKVLYDSNGDELYVDPRFPNSGLSNSYEPGYEVARDKSPLELLLESKDI
jgi:transcriptional regulator, xre family